MRKQRKDRPNFRWINGLEKDLLGLRTKYGRTLAGRRLVWKMLLEKAKATLGCREIEEERNYAVVINDVSSALSSNKTKVGLTAAAYNLTMGSRSSRYLTAVTEPRLPDVQVGAVS
ncbi:hypothetical protein TNCV_1805091 [Trichonephila clavipes]|nr:hypothetical protein TNCV_1805091 [Trichonephila clavipes]